MQKISNFMTPCPHTIDGNETITHAVQFMQLRGIRHLPVVTNGELVGVLSEHEAKLLQLLTQATPFQARVADVCNKEPHLVSADRRISAVALEMADQRLDYVLVVDGDENVVGIFTTSDACRYIHYLTSNA